MSFKHTEKQDDAIKLFAGNSIHNLLYGGSRSGKTFIIIRAIIIRACKVKSRHVSLRKHFNSIRTSIWLDTLPKVLSSCFPDLPVKKDNQNFFIEFPNGSEYWIAGLDDDKRAEKILGKEFCVDPNSLILKSDLTWVKARELTVGTELIAFPENIDGHIKLIPSLITGCKKIQATKYKIITDRGETIVSKNHQFVTYYDDRRHKNFRSNSWRKASELSIGDKIKFLGKPWETINSWQSGWIAGMYDGEGWISIEKKFQRSSLGLAQNKGKILNCIKDILTYFEICFREHNQNEKCESILTKSVYDSMRILGICRPFRLMEKSRYIWNNRKAFAANPKTYYAEIKEIIPLGRDNVIALETTTKTFISDGFLSHNSTLHFNECSELNYNSVQLALTRLAEKNQLKKKAYYDENPPRKNHWSYLQFIKKLNPIDNVPLLDSNDYLHLLMNPKDNIENIDENYLNLLNSLPEKEKARFRDGEFTDVDDGVAYYSFDREKHVGSVKRRPGTVMIGMDFNVDPMSAVIGQFIDGVFCIIDEVFLRNSDTFKMCDYLLKRNYIGIVYPDSTGRNRKTSGQSDHDILRLSGFTIESTRNPFVTDRVNNINRLFQQNRIKIDPRCVKLINDLEKVSWKNNSLDQKTDSLLTHISDALGYWCWAIEPIEGNSDNRLNISRI